MNVWRRLKLCVILVKILTREVQHKQGLSPAVCDFTFLCYLYFGADILDEVNLKQQYLQTKGVSLDKVVTKLEALRLFLHEKRSYLVEHAIEQALSKSDQYGISV